METIRILALLFAAYFFLWAVYVAIICGERYMKWYLRAARMGNCDLRRFKIIHASFMCISALCFLLIGLKVNPYIPMIVIIASIFLQRILLYKYGKKAE